MHWAQPQCGRWPKALKRYFDQAQPDRRSLGSFDGPFAPKLFVTTPSASHSTAPACSAERWRSTRRGWREGPSEVLFLAELIILMLVGRLLEEAMQRIRPSVMGQLLAGILLRPSVLGALWPICSTPSFQNTGRRP